MKITDSRQLDWGAAHAAAERLLQACRSAGYVAPEALDIHRRHIDCVCAEINAIVSALHITPPQVVEVVS